MGFSSTSRFTRHHPPDHLPLRKMLRAQGGAYFRVIKSRHERESFTLGKESHRRSRRPSGRRISEAIVTLREWIRAEWPLLTKLSACQYP